MSNVPWMFVRIYSRVLEGEEAINYESEPMICVVGSTQHYYCLPGSDV